MCAVLGVSTSGYYKWKVRQPSLRAIENEELTEHITRIHSQSKGTYGSPRITQAMHRSGYFISRPRVAKLMKAANLLGDRRAKYICTTQSEHLYKTVSNVLNRRFDWPLLKQAWVSDLTYIHTSQGWLYLTVVIDLASRKVIGWSLSSDMTCENTTIAAWEMAVLHQPIDKPLIFHSDRGVQYAADSFTRLLAKEPFVTQSMSRKGNCWDNAVAESFFKTLKSECIYRNQVLSKKQTELAVFEYIETWFNTQRMHSSIGYKTPSQQEEILINQQMAA